MQCRFSFKHMESSQALMEYTEPKILTTITKFATKPIEALVTFSVEAHQHKAHLHIKGGDGFHGDLDAVCEDMYGSVDILVEKLEKQFKKQKEKIKNHKKVSSLKTLAEMEDVVGQDDCDVIPVDAEDLIKFERAKKRA